MRSSKKCVVTTLALTALLGLSAVANADVTGDFKVTGSVYTGDVATVSGSVNRGAIQSNKTVNVDVSYTYSFRAEKTEIIEGEKTPIYLIIPATCFETTPTTNAACYYQNTQGNHVKGDRKGNWTDTTTDIIIGYNTTDPKTITHKFEGSSGMTAITEPTIEKGRLNPKGKITGYSFDSKLSIVPNSDIVDPNKVPSGYSIVPGSVEINSISYKAYLTDAAGLEIADTIVNGTISVD